MVGVIPKPTSAPRSPSRCSCSTSTLAARATTPSAPSSSPRTGARDAHLLVGARRRWPAPVLPESRRELVGRLGVGLDIKTPKGLVLLPPSLHGATHQPYRWEDTRTPIATCRTSSRCSPICRRSSSTPWPSYPVCCGRRSRGRSTTWSGRSPVPSPGSSLRSRSCPQHCSPWTWR
jgi:bifunctional DNA primase/polymerase-like protein